MTLGRLDYPGADVYLRLDSRYAPMRLRSCEKEPWTVEWLETSLRAGDVLYDIGANVGAYSLVASRQAGGDVRVVAFEPGFASFAALCDNIIVNDAADRVLPLSVTLDDRTELGVFNYRDIDSGSGLHSTGDRRFLKGRFDPVYRQPVLLYRLDDLLATFDLPPPNHVKLDVDGAELSVLGGAEHVLSSSELRSLMIEVNEDEESAVVELLDRHGLELQARHVPATTHGHWYGLFGRA